MGSPAPLAPMRALLPLLLLLAVAPALAQEVPVDPGLVGTWVLDEVEHAPSGGLKVVSMTLSISAEGDLVVKMVGVGRGGEARSETERARVTTENGRILDGQSPVDYTLVDADTLRISDDRLSIRFRRASS